MMKRIKESLALRTSLLLAVPMLALTTITAFFITHRQTDMMEQLTLEKATTASKLGARYYGEALEKAIDSSVLTVQDIFDHDYQEISGYEWGQNPKYHTKYDSYTDHTVLRFQDELLRNEDFVFAIGEDVNGYLPTHNTKYQKPVTGDPAVDNVGNRSKRIFDDEVGISAAKNLDEVMVQDYHRDTGERMWDVSSPIFVKGKHWGAFRVAVSMERIAERSTELLMRLMLTFVALSAGALLLILFVVSRAMRPVEHLSASALRLSMGEDLDEPLKARTLDEVGRLTKSLDRLRISMSAAMKRLGE